MALWKLVRNLPEGGVVAPQQRLPWLQTIGIGVQHVLAMAGATLLVPALTGFPPSTTVLFSGIGTILFLLMTRGKVPSYLGSSFAFIAPVVAAMNTEAGIGLALVYIFMAGLMLFLVGLLVEKIGYKWINVLMPAPVTGAIVALIGLNLAPVAKASVENNWNYALVTIIAVIVTAAIAKGFLGRISIIIGASIGWIVAWQTGGLDQKKVDIMNTAAWFGMPEWHTPQFMLTNIMMGFIIMIPVVIALIAENTGHVKAVGEMTKVNLDGSLGKAFMGDGLATILASLFGGSGTTTYAENIGNMAQSKVYSTAPHIWSLLSSRSSSASAQCLARSF